MSTHPLQHPPCPTCGESAGPCIDADGRTEPANHASRIYATRDGGTCSDLRPFTMAPWGTFA